uniref:Cytochrome c oxidase polypeptide II n=1 Tax=Panagrellus redivivus TaxID=6233 RepID=A0A7E4WBR5_PANRE
MFSLFSPSFPLFLYILTTFLNQITCLDSDHVTLASGYRFRRPVKSNLSTPATPESKSTSIFHGWEVILFAVIIFVVFPLAVYVIQHWHYKSKRRPRTDEYEPLVA